MHALYYGRGRDPAVMPSQMRWPLSKRRLPWFVVDTISGEVVSKYLPAKNRIKRKKFPSGT